VVVDAFVLPKDRAIGLLLKSRSEEIRSNVLCRKHSETLYKGTFAEILEISLVQGKTLPAGC
jgi:hypothetical protein